MLLRCKQMGTQEVNDYRCVDFWKVLGQSGLEVVSLRYDP
jgi:hypothetical protein